MFKSIRSKLVIWYLSVFSTVFAVLGFSLYYELKGIVIGSVDSHLHSEVQFLASLIGEEKGDIELEISGKGAVGDYALPLSGHYYQVSRGGRIFARSPSLSIVDAYLPATGESFEPSYTSIVGPEKSPLRLLTQSFRLPAGVVTIQASESLEDPYRLIDSFRNIIFLTLPSIFLLSLIGIWVITKLSLRRLNILSRKVGQITEKNLEERIEGVKMDRELRPLVEGFNTMLSRLNDAFTIQRRFLSNASHELRTPTSVIKSYCDVTLNKERTQAQYRDVLRRISEAANRMSDTINKILEVSRLESNTFSFKPSNIDLKAIMKDVVRFLKPSASAMAVKIGYSGIDVSIVGDRERLLEAFINIVDNGIKYNRRGGRVDIEVGKRDGWAVATVTDTGIGIPDSEKERIFDRFYRLDSSRNRVEGCGLGLSIARSVIEAHRGRMEVESKVGKGTRFFVFLPLT